MGCVIGLETEDLFIDGTIPQERLPLVIRLALGEYWPKT